MTNRSGFLEQAIKNVDIESICMYCNKDGCKNEDGRPVPCDCEWDCKHDNECACDCHSWMSVLRWAHKSLTYLEKKLDEHNSTANRLAQALLESHCECPNYAPCECERDNAIKEWEKVRSA